MSLSILFFKSNGDGQVVTGGGGGGAVVKWQWKPLATTLHVGGSDVMTVLLLNWSNSTVRVLPECQSSPIQG